MLSASLGVTTKCQLGNKPLKISELGEKLNYTTSKVPFVSFTLGCKNIVCSTKLESHKVLLRSNLVRGVKRPEGGRREEKD